MPSHKLLLIVKEPPAFLSSGVHRFFIPSALVNEASSVLPGNRDLLTRYEAFYTDMLQLEAGTERGSQGPIFRRIPILNSLATYQDNNFIHLYWRQTSLYRLYALQNESKQEIGCFYFYLFGVIIINFWYKILRYWSIFLRTFNFSRSSLIFYNWSIFLINFNFIRKQTKTPWDFGTK